MSFFFTVLLLAHRGIAKVIRRPVTLTFSVVQPLIWMFFFGFLMQRFPLQDLPDSISYVSFLVPGICAMTVLFGASQAGVTLIRDMQTGFLQRMLLTPVSLNAVMFGKLAADALRLSVQALVVLGVGLLVGATLVFEPMSLLLAFFQLFLFGIAFSSLSCLIALRAKRQETMATFVHVVNMPIFFTSTALVPTKQMPDWLASVATYNPLSLAVDGLRQSLLFGNLPSSAFTLVFLMVAGVAFFLAAIYQLHFAHRVSAWETR